MIIRSLVGAKAGQLIDVPSHIAAPLLADGRAEDPRLDPPVPNFVDADKTANGQPEAAVDVRAREHHMKPRPKGRG